MCTEKEITSVDTYTEELLHHLAENGYQGRIVSTQHLPELEKEIKGRFNQGLFDEEFYQSRLTSFRFEIPETLPNAKSIIVVAVPRPQAQVTFTFKGKRKALILPPTYVAYEKTTNHIADFLNGILKEKGYQIARTALPLKILAVRSGLAEYGRNNITYISSMGSFFQLAAFYSDLPCQKDSWREAQVMEKCEKCQACLRSCPTGAISPDRFLLHGERCISFLNERKGNIPFPNWTNPSWHNCLYGCLHCQRVCPEDKRFMNWIGEKVEFSQEETELLLKGQLVDHVPDVTLKKLSNLDLSDPDSLDNLPRNLGVFSESNENQQSETQKRGEKIMPEMIAYCGLRCDECKILKATQTKDYEQKKQIAKRWSDQFNIKFKPEDINCEGCKSKVLSGWCRKICKVRPCAEERKVETCAHCDSYPCDILKEFLKDEPIATKNIETIRKTLQP